MNPYVDVIAQDAHWDEVYGPGSYCVFVKRVPCGTRNSLDVAREIAKEGVAESVERGYFDRYYMLVSGDGHHEFVYGWNPKVVAMQEP